MKNLDTDVLVIGSGGAGLYAAVRAAEAGAQVAVLDKGLIGRAGGTVGGSGVAAVGPWSVPGDSTDVHLRDTLAGGAHLNDPKLARTLVEEASQRIVELESWGIRFDREPDGRYVLDTAGGHSYHRCLAVSDRVGLQISKVLRSRVMRLGVERLPDVVVTRLLVCDRSVVGAMGINLRTGDILTVSAPTVILATGGIGQLYPRTTNPVQCTGDGLALALRAGARLINMEQVQFYPCCLVYPPSLRGFGLGLQEYSRLFNAAGERFMSRYEPTRLEKTTRDRLSRAIYAEIAAGRATDHGGVYLDATGVPEETLHSFQHELELCEQQGLDLRQQPAEVAPGAHYFMGGIAIDVDGRTSLPGLFAAGEVSAGVHGGNRLSGNSLADIVVFGARAGISAARYARGAVAALPAKEQIHEEQTRLERLLSRGHDGLSAGQGKDLLRQVMWQGMGVVRNEQGLLNALYSLVELKGDALRRVSINGPALVHNQSVVAYCELENMLLVAETIARSALERTESRGAHFREDFPEPDPGTPYCTEIQLIAGQPALARRPVEVGGTPLGEAAHEQGA